jgi:hypothetical protein
MRKLMSQQQLHRGRPSTGSMPPPVPEEAQAYARTTQAIKTEGDRGRGVMKGVATAVGRGPGPPPRRTVSGVGSRDDSRDDSSDDTSSSDDSDADEI